MALKMKLYRNDEMEPRSIVIRTRLRGKKTANEPHSLIDCLIQEKSIMSCVGDLWLK